MSDYDSPWKEVLDVYLEPFLQFFFPLIHHDIDWPRGHETLERSSNRSCPTSPSAGVTWTNW
jgi:hypothetical protein